jgi:D-alanyl-D-alanine carboxypeptidase
MKLAKLILLFFICSLLSARIWADVSPLKQAQIQQLLNNWRARAGIPSATLSVILPNHSFPITFITGTTAYGSNEKTHGNTLFQAGSITKSFTSTVILQLEAEGKLNIDDPITKYLPQYSRWQNVTIRQLLNHTSGIFNYTNAGTFNHIRLNQPQAAFTPEQIVHIASQHRDYFSPGYGWKYSNTNYVLAGMIIQKVTGQSLHNIMNYYLHGGLKLNLANTHYVSGLYSNEFISRMAHGYNSNGSDVTTDNMSWANTAGAIVSTSQDLLAWWRGLFQNKILPPEQMSEMMSLVCETESSECRAGGNRSQLTDSSIGKGYGLGIIQSSYGSSRVGTVWWHNGSTRGYKALVMWYPKSNIYMAITINRDPGFLLKPNLAVIQRILNILTSETSWSMIRPTWHASYYHRRYHRRHHTLTHHKRKTHIHPITV